MHDFDFQEIIVCVALIEDKYHKKQKVPQKSFQGNVNAIKLQMKHAQVSCAKETQKVLKLYLCTKYL